MSLFNIPKFDFPKLNPELTLDLRDPDEITKEILEFLRQTTIEQSKTSIRQFQQTCY